MSTSAVAPRTWGIVRRRRLTRRLTGVLAGVIALVGVLGFAGTAPAAAALPGPWVIHSTFSGPPLDDHLLESRCQARGVTLVHYYPQGYTAYRCTRDAPYYWRLWMQLRLPS